MKIFILLLAGVFLISCKPTAQTVVVVGDSWASFVCVYKSLDSALQKAGIHDAGTNSSCPLTTQLGAQAKNWLGDTFHKAARLALSESSVKVIYLSLGGNDFLNNWHKGMTAPEEEALFDKIASDINAVVQVYKTARPDVKILISAYDFPRFTLNHPITHYAEMFDKMGRPAPIELNSAILRFSAHVSKLADLKQIFYIQHYGLMHYYAGNADAGLAPGTTLAPEFISSPDAFDRPGGDPNLQTDPSAMMKVRLGSVAVITDAFHLNRMGFDRLAEHTVFHYLHSWLAP